MKSLRLDALLGDRYPEASFHDSRINSITLDFAARKAAVEFSVPVDLENQKLVFKAGRLEIEGLHAFSTEPPRTLYGVESSALWVTWDGALPDETLDSPLKIPDGLPESAFCHAFFVSSTNSFLVIAGEQARFVWYNQSPAAQRPGD